METVKKTSEKNAGFTDTEDLSRQLYCSQTMDLSLRQCMKYRSLIGAPFPGEEKAKDRREGKLLLTELVRESRLMPLPFSAKGQKNPSPLRRLFIEEQIVTDQRVQRIREFFPELPAEEITHYKDIFRRTHKEGEEGKALILAEKKGTLLYPGAPVCQDFGNHHFYYASNVMNCIYDCEYCYLKGMYPSDHMVVFLNLGDYFRETEELLKKHPVYLCISYDTDLLAIEKWTGLLEKWCDFAAGKKDLTIEIRTKSANTAFFEKAEPMENVIFAFTLSPDPVIEAFEHFTPSLHSRLSAIKRAMEKGFPVRLCFDPMLYCEDWKKTYGEMLDFVMEEIDPSEIRDISVGTFRLSQGYLSTMRKKAPESALIQYPYENTKGVYGYEKPLSEEMTEYLVSKIHKYLPQKKIFLWK